MLGASPIRDIAKIAILMLLGAIMSVPAMAAEPPIPIVDKEIHMGVFSCSGSTCHGAVQAWPNANVLQNEYVTWQRRDKHAKAYAVLLNEQSKRIARNLGLKDAKTAAICLDCHADNVPKNRRHGTFQIADGVTCEACHGGAGRWIGTHIAANATHANNVSNGLFPTANPVNRARLCLSCHQGDDNKRMTHRIMGAGHPRLSFELDTFTAIQPAHYRVDADYAKRKGNWNGVKTWAIGQTIAVNGLLDLIIDPKRNRDGMFPELVIFDCYSCHRTMSGKKWSPRETTGIGPGFVEINDSNLLMLQIITRRVDPALSDQLKTRSRALHKASTESFDAVVTQAKALRQITGRMVQKFASHRFAKGDLTALFDGIVAMGLKGEYVSYAGAEQATMALSSIINALRDTGAINKSEFATLDKALKTVYNAVAKDESYDNAAMMAALKTLQAAKPRG